jgi:hypothetical protein
MNEHDRSQAERRHQATMKSQQYKVPFDLAAVMSDDVLRLAEDYALRTSLVSPRGLGSAAASPAARRGLLRLLAEGERYEAPPGCCDLRSSRAVKTTKAAPQEE